MFPYFTSRYVLDSETIPPYQYESGVRSQERYYLRSCQLPLINRWRSTHSNTYIYFWSTSSSCI